MLDLGVLAVRNFREEDSVLSLSVEVLLVTWVLEVVHAGAGILLGWKIIVLHLGWLKQFPLDLA